MGPVPLFATALTIGIAYIAIHPGRAAAQSPLVIHKEGTSEFHRPWCPVVRDGQGALALTRAQAQARGLRSHAACEKEPPVDPSAPAPATGTAGRKPPPPVFVYVDGTKYYHRDKCSKSDGQASRVTLDDAGRTRWPCPICRPPVRKKSDGPAVPPRRRD